MLAPRKKSLLRAQAILIIRKAQAIAAFDP
jgi:hypothetical protein